MRGGDAKHRRSAREETFAERRRSAWAAPARVHREAAYPGSRESVSFRASNLVAPVEISALGPEAVLFFRVRRHIVSGVLPGPGQHRGLDRDGRLLAVHRLLETSLFLGLEQRVVVERIRVLVVPEGH